MRWSFAASGLKMISIQSRPAGRRKRQRWTSLQLEALEDRRLLSTVDWVGGRSGAWEDAQNWLDDSNHHRVPTSADDADIDIAAAVTVSISSVASARSLTGNLELVHVLSGGTLTVGAGGVNASVPTLTVEASANADISGQSSLGNVSNLGTIHFNGLTFIDPTMADGDVSNSGTLSFNDGGFCTSLELMGGSLTVRGQGLVVHRTASFNRGSVSLGTSSMGINGATTIQGTTWTGAAGSSLYMGSATITGATISVPDLQLNGSGTITDSMLNAGVQGGVGIRGTTWNLAGTTTATGMVALGAMNTNVTGSFNASQVVTGRGTNLNLTGSMSVSQGDLAGNLMGSGNLTASTALNWQEGTVSGSGTITVTGAGGVMIDGNVTLNRSLASAGPVVFSLGTLTGSGSLTANGGFTLSGGTLSDAVNLTVQGAFNWSSGTMDGSGTVTVEVFSKGVF